MSTTTQRRSSTWKLAAILAALVALALAVAIATTGGDDGAPTRSAFGEPVVTGTALPRLGSDVDEAVGARAPTAVGIGVNGQSVTVGGSGPQVIAFLAHWCPHCRAEVPVVVDWLDQGRRPAEVELVAVATSTDEGQPNFPPQDWLEREDWRLPTLLDDEDDTVGRAFGVSNFPFWVVLDADGVVVLRGAGELTHAELDALFAAALG